MSSSDTIQQSLNINGNTIIIYNNRKPDSYLESDIYDPDNPASGKYFPSLYSVVIKTDGSLWYVSDRNESTYRVTLTPCSIITAENENDIVKVVTYGNDRYCLYQDTRVSPYKLIVDAKVLFYGNSLKEYTLSYLNDDGTEEIISLYLDSTDTFISDRIPMTSVSENVKAYKFPTNCHTTKRLTEGDTVTLRVYNNLGNLAAVLTLFVRNAVWLNDLQSSSNPIIELNAECLQERGSDWYIKERQDTSHLNIQPYLTYADGTRVNVAVDNRQCFIYGLEDFIPSYPGYSQTIIIKYFLGRKESSIDDNRFLTCTKRLVVVKEKEDFSVKVTPIPIFNRTRNQWYLRYFVYTDDRNGCHDITDQCSYSDFPFDGSPEMWGTEQHVVVDYDLSVALNLGEELPGSQSFYITVWDPSSYERYTIRDSKDTDILYGADGSVVRRPILNYDMDIDSYFIPTSVFRNKEAVIESFYTNARPFFDTRTETVAPTPTHFVVRDALNGNQINSSPIELVNFGAAFKRINTNTSLYLNQTVVVEFLQLVADTYVVLYGVPVDVRAGTYNTENN